MNAAQAASLAEGGARQSLDPLAIGFFLAFVAVTLVITWKAATRTRWRAAFYTAGGDITALQNGLAMAGDFMSAAAFLELTASMTISGFDGMIYALGTRPRSFPTTRRPSSPCLWPSPSRSRCR